MVETFQLLSPHLLLVTLCLRYYYVRSNHSAVYRFKGPIVTANRIFGPSRGVILLRPNTSFLSEKCTKTAPRDCTVLKLKCFFFIISIQTWRRYIHFSLASVGSIYSSFPQQILSKNINKSVATVCFSYTDGVCLFALF